MNILIYIERKGRKILKRFLSRLISPSQVQGEIKKPENVIIIRVDERLGNLVLLNAAVKSFVRNNIETSLVVCKKYGEIYKYNHHIKEIIYFNKKSLFNPFNIFRLFFRLRKKKYDLLFDASNPNDLSALTFFVMMVIRAGIKFGYRRKESDMVLNKLVPVPEKKMHMPEYYALLFKYLGLKSYNDFHFAFPVNVLQKYNYLKEKKIIIVHPGGRDNKKWRTRRLLLFLEKIRNKKYKFIILLGPDEYKVEKIFLSEKYDVIKPEDVLGLVSVLSAGKIYIGIDSGPMHLAGALGLAVFAIYKPLASIIFKPIARYYRMVISDYPPDLSVREVCNKYQQFISGVRP